MIDLDIALKRMTDALAPLCMAVETIPIMDAAGRHLAADIRSKIDLPPFDKSAMDGFAILPGDHPESFGILETIRAGDTPSRDLAPGYCSRIMTGAPVPAGTGQVIPVECTEVAAERMRIIRPTRAPNICIRGEDIRAGHVVARRGDRLDPLNLSVLISCGIETVPVVSRPRVTVFSTGDELVSTLAEWGPGKIFDSNGPMLAELFRRHGAHVIARRHLPDDPGDTVAMLRDAMNGSDVIAFSGGVSAGDFDFIPDALTACGLTIHFDRIRVKPGKPMTFATGERICAFGFPGNPVSSFVMFHLFALPALQWLQHRPVRHRMVQLPMAETWRRKKAERLEFIPVRIVPRAPGDSAHPGESAASMAPLPYHGSAHLTAMQSADGLAVIDAGISSVAAGDLLPFWPVTWTAYETAVI